MIELINASSKKRRMRRVLHYSCAAFWQQGKQLIERKRTQSAGVNCALRCSLSLQCLCFLLLLEIFEIDAPALVVEESAVQMSFFFSLFLREIEVRKTRRRLRAQQNESEKENCDDDQKSDDVKKANARCERKENEKGDGGESVCENEKNEKSETMS